MADENKNQLMETKDLTSEYDPKDIESGKVMSIISYISLFVLVPMFLGGDSKFTRFHVNQGLILAVVEVLVWAIRGILGGLPIVGWIFRIVCWLISFVCVVFSIIGILNAVNGRAKELPFIGGIRLVK